MIIFADDSHRINTINDNNNDSRCQPLPIEYYNNNCKPTLSADLSILERQVCYAKTILGVA